MKPIIMIIVFLVSFGISSFGTEITNFKKTIKIKSDAYQFSQTAKKDSIPNFSIKINGKQNTVRIMTDSLTIQTSESILNTSKNSIIIEIAGEGNSASVNQDSKGKVEVKQSGNNNHINISQSSHKP